MVRVHMNSTYLASSGEDDIAFSTESDYAANVEMAEAVLVGERAAPAQSIEISRYTKSKNHCGCFTILKHLILHNL